MKCEQVKYQLIDVIDGNITDKLKMDIESHLKKCNTCQDEYIQTGKLLNGISKTDLIEPSIKLKTCFYQMLEAEKTSLHVNPLKPKVKIISSKYLKPLLKVAAQIIVFVSVGTLVGIRLGNKNKQSQEMFALQKEVVELKQNMSLVSLNQPSASQRIQAIHTVNKQPEINCEILNALIHTMNTDANVNVRMASMYALAKYADNENVRIALITSLKNQTDPLLQITLINILVNIQDGRAKKPLQDIMNNGELPDMVKKQAENGLEAFI